MKINPESMALAETILQSYVCSANSAVSFVLANNENDVKNDRISFNPEYTHQFFGDSENIFGYKDLEVKIYVGAARLTTCFTMKYTDKIKTSKTNDVHADDVEKIVCEKMQPGYLTNSSDFISSLEKESSFKPFGELLHTLHITNEKDNSDHTYEIYHCDIMCPGFKEYHERMQMFVMWFIDAASYIDSDDDKWEFFVMYEKVQKGSSSYYCFVGYSTVYLYYAYPTKIRPRISQLLILPPFQKQGLATELIRTIYNKHVKNNEVTDITVEDPSDEFTRLRDFVDSQNCMKLESFHPDLLKKGFSKEMWKEAQDKLKINKKQCRRVYEILRLKATNMSVPEDYRAYRLCVKNRLNAPFQRQKCDVMKLQRVLKPEEFKAALHGINQESRIELLEKQYRELEEDYRRILERLARC